MPIVRPVFRPSGPQSHAPGPAASVDAPQPCGGVEQPSTACALPGLQLALEDDELQPMMEPLSVVESEVSVIRLGPVLLMCEGLRAVREIRDRHPDRALCADLRIGAGGGDFARYCFQAGADWVTCAADVPPATIADVVDVAEEFDGQVQIELGDAESAERARAWRMRGATHVTLRCSPSAGAVGSPARWRTTRERIEKLQRWGLRVSVAGTFAAEDLAGLVDTGVESVIVGEHVTAAADPLAAVTAFTVAIERACV